MHRMILPLVVVSLFLCSCGKKNKPADAPESSPVTPTPPKVERYALYRFWDSRLNEHVYSYGDGEPADWRRSGVFHNETIVGYVSTEPLPDTDRLYRAYRRNRLHYFYLGLPPNKGADIERIEAFGVYVWTKPGDGRIPIHFCSLPDGTDPLFDKSLAHIQKATADTLRVQSIQRKVVENYFYVYPAGPTPTPTPAATTTPTPVTTVNPATTTPTPVTKVDSPAAGPHLADQRLAGIELSSNGKWVLGRSNVGGRLAVGAWELGSGKYYGSFGANTGIERFAVSPDGTLGASVAAEAQLLHLWNLPGGGNRTTVELRPAPGGKKLQFPPFVQFSADGKTVYTAVEDSFIGVSVEKGTGKVLLAGVNTSCLAYSPTKNVLAEYRTNFKNPSGSEVRVFDLTAGGQPKTFPGPAGLSFSGVSAIDISANGDTLAIGGGETEAAVTIFDAASGQRKATIPVAREKNVQFSDVRLSPDGRRVAAAARISKGAASSTLLLVAETSGKNAKVIPTGLDFFEITDFTPDGKFFAASQPRGVKVIDAETGSERTP
ncbi:MAG TPA: WD40 repeat domain-containing protein [Urbifossiella sp.]|nr:WD40 repeat domain-containing protein [Urbifossiella sp.]